MIPDQIEYLKNWLFRANEDIDVIKYLSKTELDSYQSTICMHAQQAVEKFLKFVPRSRQHVSNLVP